MVSQTQEKKREQFTITILSPLCLFHYGNLIVNLSPNLKKNKTSYDLYIGVVWISLQ